PARGRLGGARPRLRGPPAARAAARDPGRRRACRDLRRRAGVPRARARGEAPDMNVALDILRELDGADAVARDQARARLVSMGEHELRGWEALYGEARRLRLGEGAVAILNQECLEFFARARPPLREWVPFLARAMVAGSPALAHRRALHEFLATVFE